MVTLIGIIPAVYTFRHIDDKYMYDIKHGIVKASSL